MTPRPLTRFLCAAAAALAVPFVVPTASASADGCPDIDVVFARGTAEAPGIGLTGESFVAALRLSAGARSVGVTPVNYPASSDFQNPIAFAHTVIAGIRDAGDHVRFMAAACPNTRIVLGGYSQGAFVAKSVTASSIPASIPDQYRGDIPAPLPLSLADNVAALVSFGAPSPRFLSEVGAPYADIGDRYLPKTIELCNPGDNICDGSPLGWPNVFHSLYALNGQTLTAAQFVVARL